MNWAEAIATVALIEAAAVGVLIAGIHAIYRRKPRQMAADQHTTNSARSSSSGGES